MATDLLLPVLAQIKTDLLTTSIQAVFINLATGSISKFPYAVVIPGPGEFKHYGGAGTCRDEHRQIGIMLWGNSNATAQLARTEVSELWYSTALRSALSALKCIRLTPSGDDQPLFYKGGKVCTSVMFDMVIRYQ